jgi:aspartyl-tRNA(Asn)/glutamyl-tRNA(Gln) amidotransferase subunit A
MTVDRSQAISRHVEQCLSAIERMDPTLRAMITVTAGPARDAARAQDVTRQEGRATGPLAGMTVALKDVIATAGVRTTNGSEIDRDVIPDEDAEVVRRLKAAGAIVVGKANLHEYAYGGTSQNPFYGACRNPWDIARIPGGSSGGSAAAAASFMCDASLGTDTAGSGRLPAALCGIGALRPTWGAIPNRGITALSPFFDTVSPMARSVADIARVFDAIAGHDAEDPFSSAPPMPRQATAADIGLGGLRIGVPEDYFFEDVDPGVEAATRAAILELASLDAEVVRLSVPDASLAPGHFEKLFHSDAAHEHRERYARSKDRLGTDTRERLEALGRSFSAMDYAGALAWMQRWKWQVARIFQEVDLIAHPTAPTVAPTIADCVATTAVTRRLAKFLYPWSLAQVPVLSLPVGLAEHGMPCGLSLAAPWWREDLLFRVGTAFQQATRWHHLEPPIVTEWRRAEPAEEAGRNP